MILLYNPPSNAARKPVLPMSLLSVAAVLEGKRRVTVVDGNLDASAHATIDEIIRREEVRVLGVTVMPGPQLHDAVPLCRALKARHPDLTIVWGGYFPTQHADACLESGFVDYVVVGHGEHVFVELIDTLESGGDPSDVLGLAFVDDRGAVVRTPKAPIPDPETLPRYPYDRVDMSRYVRPTFMGSRTLPHHSSYGCPFLCNFCAVVNLVEGRWLAESAARTAETTEHLVRRYGANAVEFYDNNFFVSERRVAEFAERIAPLNIAWWGEARIDTLLKFRPETWRLMRGSGLRMVFMGAESGDDATLERMNKGGTAAAAKTLEIAEKMRELDIVPEFSFMLGNPPDAMRDVESTIGFIRRVKKINPASEIILYLYTPVPLAGDLLHGATESGFAFPKTLDEWVDPEWVEFSQRHSRTIPWLDDPVRRRVKDFERVLNAYYPTTTDPSLRGGMRALLRTASAWRYHSGFYRFPIELKLLHRVMPHQRPDTAGF